MTAETGRRTWRGNRRSGRAGVSRRTAAAAVSTMFVGLMVASFLPPAAVAQAQDREELSYDKPNPAAPALGAAPGLEDVDARTGAVQPTPTQREIVEALGAEVRWSRYGTPQSLVRYGGYLARGLRARNAVDAALRWVEAQGDLFLASTGDLELVTDGRLSDSDGFAVTFRQRFRGLPAAEGGLLTVGIEGSATRSWSVAYASSTLTGDGSLAAASRLTPQQAWLRAAANVGRATAPSAVLRPKHDREWATFAVRGFSQPQRARFVAVPTPLNGVRPAYEVLLLDEEAGHWTAYQHYVDAATGAVLIRRNMVLNSHPPADHFEGTMPPENGACAPDNGPWIVGPGESVESIAVGVEAALTTNDAVLHLVRDGEIVASQDTVFSPEALVYDPAESGQGTYHVRVCDYEGGAGWLQPRDYAGGIVFSPVGAGTLFPYPPRWKVFPAYPELGSQTYPWDYPSADTREVWCWESTVGFPPKPVTDPACDREVQNLASRVPWDYHPRTNTPTFTTVGNNANTAEAWMSPFTPGPFSYRPVSPDRDYLYPWKNTWSDEECDPTSFQPGAEPDLSAAVTNLFVQHNRMHDWSYFLGFTERHWNAQDSNFGTGGTAQFDPLHGDVQAGAVSGGPPSYLGRDNANMIPLPDGIPPITNMYLWQPIAGAFYAPCVDGDFTMSVIGHEYGHLTENRMIGKGGRRGGHHAGAMGESFGDFSSAEYLNEYGFVPLSGENPFAVGPYVTANHQRAIRNYGMNFPRVGAFPQPGVSLAGPEGALVNPLNFSDLGYDIVGQQVHANGEIWSAVNFDIRQALVEKYDDEFPSSDRQLQDECADGERAADECPGNRRWIQLVFDAMLLMPVAPSMLDARDAYLAADQMRFGGANQQEIWLAFARRGFGETAFSTNSSAESEPTSDRQPGSDSDPTPSFESPLHNEATVRFGAVAPDEGNAPVEARVYVGHYEARVSPIADTDPTTPGKDDVSEAEPDRGTNLDEVARFVPGTYEFVAQARGHGHVRFRATLAAGENRAITIAMPTNWASVHEKAVASGDGEEHNKLIDDTEASNWDEPNGGDPVNDQKPQVTVDLAGDTPRSVKRVNVSAMLLSPQNRWTALRQFRIDACTANDANQGCTAKGSFSTVYTSPPDAFPGFNPRPVAPEMILRSFDVPTTAATHVRITVLHNQCTGDEDFQGVQDADSVNGTDCREGSPGSVGPLPGDLVPQVIGDRDDEVHIAELQVFSSDAVVDGGVSPPPGRGGKKKDKVAGNVTGRGSSGQPAQRGTTEPPAEVLGTRTSSEASGAGLPVTGLAISALLLSSVTLLAGGRLLARRRHDVWARPTDGES